MLAPQNRVTRLFGRQCGSITIWGKRYTGLGRVCVTICATK